MEIWIFYFFIIYLFITLNKKSEVALVYTEQNLWKICIHRANIHNLSDFFS